MKNIQIAAERLASAASQKKLCSGISDLIDMTSLDQAYAVQKALNEIVEDKGSRRCGYKVGLTSQVAQNAFGATEPMFGILFDEFIIPNEGQILYRNMAQPKIEGEILFRVGTPPKAGCSEAALIASIDIVHAAFEIAESRVEGWARDIVTAIADNACCGHFAIAPSGIPPAQVDLSKCSMVLTSASEDAIVSEGVGVNCLGNPLNSYRWLVETLPKHGFALSEGDFVLTGALGPMVSMETVEEYNLGVQGVGQVSLSCTDSPRIRAT